MNPMIERVVRALRDRRDPACPWEDYVPDARAALLAEREPTGSHGCLGTPAQPIGVNR